MTVLDEQDIREIHDDRYAFSDLEQDHASLRSLITSKKLGYGLTTTRELLYWKFNFILPTFDRLRE